MKRIILAALYFWMIVSSAVYAAVSPGLFDLDSVGIATGTVQSTGRNSLDLYDEDLRTVKRFVCLEPAAVYHSGDRVRVFYDRSDNRVRNIKKMTVLDYSRDIQNLGYLMKN